MKYWRGYLVAAILAACSWGLKAFAETHSTLVDMIYPYVTRMLQNFLAQWSGAVSFCVWQIALLVLLAVVLATFVLMLVMKWNPIQWFGWVLTGVSLLFFLHTGLYGLNQYAGSLAQDIRMDSTEYQYTLSELEDAAVYYRDQANKLANQIKRNSDGTPDYPDFQTMAEQAAEGFDVLTYEEHHSVFAGSRIPVKELGWSGFYTARGISGVTVPLTGEAAVNPETPAVCIPFAMCREMAHRICIAKEADANLAAFLAASYHSQPHFQYSAYLTAYRYCWGALEAVSESTGSNSARTVAGGENANLKKDLESFADFFGTKAEIDGSSCDLLVLNYVQTVVLPQQAVPEEKVFDPRDPNQVDLSGIVNALKPEE